jgi:hypothetical protein
MSEELEHSFVDKVERRLGTFSSSTIDALVLLSIQDTRSILRQHHISKASMLILSLALTVQVSQPYRRTENTSIQTQYFKSRLLSFSGAIPVNFTWRRKQPVFETLCLYTSDDVKSPNTHQWCFACFWFVDLSCLLLILKLRKCTHSATFV